MKIRVRFFAAHREATGRPTFELELPQGSSVLDAFEQLCVRFPSLRSAAASVAFAVNQTQTRADQLLHPDDELALLPPMAGG